MSAQVFIFHNMSVGTELVSRQPWQPSCEWTDCRRFRILILNHLRMNKMDNYTEFSAQYGVKYLWHTLHEISLIMIGQWVLYATLSCAAATDVAIAVALSTALFMHRTSFKRSVCARRKKVPLTCVCRTNSLIRTLILYTINTGALTKYACIPIIPPPVQD